MGVVHKLFQEAVLAPSWKHQNCVSSNDFIKYFLKNWKSNENLSLHNLWTTSLETKDAEEINIKSVA